MAVEDITDTNFKEKTDTGVTLTDLWAVWCGPCKMQSPVVEEVSNRLPNVSFNKLNVDENPKTTSELGIMAIPTLIVKKDGEIVERITGYTPADALEAIIKKHTDN
ncbi:thioredoxin [Weissella muntiaci]|uniref:Thioredoxin n=1 Tax=Weissella muntiaci TaxID=2508881 RepID=A0A6C2CC45_9LACO|nr:thioredoxin [Weissella muntiaci]TYC50963.1 thioredoxin [Weissella muntiaci]